MATALFPSDPELDEIVVGPQSVAWQRTSDARLYLVMLYPPLLQVAHPTVGAGVRDYSDFERRPWDRLLRTIDYVSLLVYGGRQAAPAGRRLRELHKRLRGIREDGERYHALEPDAYAWVHATLIETYVCRHAQFGTPMRPAPSLLWRALRMPAGQALRLGGVGLMDDWLRARLDIKWSGLDEARFRALSRLSRALTPVMPERLKVMGPAQLRFRRRAIAYGPLGALGTL